MVQRALILVAIGLSISLVDHLWALLDVAFRPKADWMIAAPPAMWLWEMKPKIDIAFIALLTLFLFRSGYYRKLFESRALSLYAIAGALTVGREALGIGVGFDTTFLTQIVIAWALCFVVWVLWRAWHRQ